MYISPDAETVANLVKETLNELSLEIYFKEIRALAKAQPSRVPRIEAWLKRASRPPQPKVTK